jgi:hypothetical protein
MVFAGYETVSTALSMTLYMLAHHPKVQTAAQQELDEVLGGKVQYKRAIYIYMYICICVSMSMYVHSRTCIEGSESVLVGWNEVWWARWVRAGQGHLGGVKTSWR